MTCSGHGVCEFSDPSGSILKSCTVLESTCTAACICQSGFGGADCSLNAADAAVKDSVRYNKCLFYIHIQPYILVCIYVHIHIYSQRMYVYIWTWIYEYTNRLFIKCERYGKYIWLCIYAEIYIPIHGYIHTYLYIFKYVFLIIFI